MTPQESRKFIEDTRQFFLDYQAQVQSELIVFESNARGKVRYVSEWMARVHDANIAHILGKTPWEALKAVYGAGDDHSGKAALPNKSKWASENHQWISTLLDYLQRAAEVLEMKSTQLALNKDFIPNPIHQNVYNQNHTLLAQVQALLSQEELQTYKELSKKTWYSSMTRVADTLIRLVVDAYGLKRDKFKETAETDVQSLAVRSYASGERKVTKSSMALEKEKAENYLSNNMAPMFELLKKKPVSSDEINKMVDELKLPNPRP